MQRLALVFGAAAAVLVGCLFPSFEELKGNPAAPADDDDSTDDSGAKTKKDASSSSGATSSSGGTSSSSSGATTSSSSSGSSSSSSSSSSGSASTKLIHCKDKTCTGDTICCSPTGGTYTCEPKSNPNCDANDIAECDGAKDCAPGQVCCQAGPGGGGSACKTGSCGGSSATYCQPDDSACPGGQSCTGSSIIGPDGFKVCE